MFSWGFLCSTFHQPFENFTFIHVGGGGTRRGRAAGFGSVAAGRIGIAAAPRAGITAAIRPAVTAGATRRIPAATGVLVAARSDAISAAEGFRLVPRAFIFTAHLRTDGQFDFLAVG